MAKYIALANWTDQGIKSVKDSPGRVDAVRALAQQLGCELQDFYLTMGGYDFVVMIEAPDDEAMATIALKIGSAGNVRTTTLKALTEDSFRNIVDRL